MASIRTEHLSVSFSIYDAGARSLKLHLMRGRSGGQIGADARNRPTVEALRDLSLDLRDGDRVALIGHNGAGKTTLLRVLAGIYAPTFGRIEVMGRVAPLFDVSLGMDPDSTGNENIRLRGLLLGLTRREVEARMADIAGFTELGPYLDMPLRTYSAGMVARLAFAVATSVEPEILLLDEAVGVGDAGFVQKATARLHALSRRAGILVFASHSDALLREFCHQGLVMERGRAVFFGPIEEALAAYHGRLSAAA